MYQGKKTKTKTYILKYDNNFYNWDNVKMDPFKTEVNT